MKHFASKLELDVRTLYSYRRFAQLCKPDEVESFIAAGLRWTHVRKLTEFDSREMRSAWVAKIIENKWNTEKFLRECSLKEDKKDARSGRKPAKPRNLKQGLERLTKAIVKQKRLFDEALFCSEFDLPREISFLSPQECSNDFHDHIGEAIKLLHEYTGTVRANLERMEEAFRQIEKYVDASESSVASEDSAENREEEAYVMNS